MSTLPEVSDETFADDVLAAKGIVLVDFWAEWCPPCRAVTPVLERIADERSEFLTVVKIDADANPRTVAEYRALALPMMIVFQNGQPIKTLLGAKPKGALEAELAPYLG